MIEFENTIVIITARAGNVNLPGLPMMDVGGKPLVARAVANAQKAGLGAVLVATPDNQVAAAMRNVGQDVLVTALKDQSHSAMAQSVLAMRDSAHHFSHIIVVPCELPLIDALSLRRCLAGLSNANVDGATLAGPADQESVWRAVAPLDGEREVAWLRGLTQDADAPALISVFAWHREALEKFATAKLSPVAHELAHALAIGLRIVAVKIDTVPLVVDTAHELETLRRLVKA